MSKMIYRPTKLVIVQGRDSVSVLADAVDLGECLKCYKRPKPVSLKNNALLYKVLAFITIPIHFRVICSINELYSFKITIPVGSILNSST